MVKGSTTLTFKPGNLQVRDVEYEPVQNRLVSSGGTVRVYEPTDHEVRTLHLKVVELPKADAGSYAGRDSLVSFIEDDIDWLQSTFTFTDTDGDAFTVSWWEPRLDLREIRQDVFSGRLVVRERGT